MVNDHSYSKRGNPLLQLYGLFASKLARALLCGPSSVALVWNIEQDVAPR